MIRFNLPAFALLLIGMGGVARPSGAQQVLFYEGNPTARHILEDIGVRQKVRSMGGPRKSLVQPSSGARYDTPNVQMQDQTTSVAPPPPPPLLGDKWIGALVQFELNQARVRQTEVATLAAVGDALRQEAGLKVIISGHADRSGTDAINDPLSLARAGAVREHLATQFGIARARMTVRGAGSHEPLEGHNPFHARNRRVQFGFTQ